MKILSLLAGIAVGAGAAVAAIKFGPKIKETVEAKMKKADDGAEVEDVEMDAETEEVEAVDTTDAE